jgi:hypothetical protein
MASLFPHRRTHTVAFGLVLVDLPVILAVAAVGWHYGYIDTYWAIADWRVDHPWSMIPSLALAVVLLVRWRRAR